MKKVKIAIIILLILIIIGIVVFFLGFQNKDNESKTNNVSQQEKIEEKAKVNVVENESMYFTVETCINNYIDYIKNDEKTAIYKILDKSYIEKNKINESNILDKIGTVPENADFDIQEMLLASGEGEEIQQYHVYGLLRSNSEQKTNKQKMYLTVNIDLKDMLFSIVPNVPDKEVFDE